MQACTPACPHARMLHQVRLKVLDALRAKYRPEFLNRLDEMVIFNPLGLAQLRSIATLQMAALQARLAATPYPYPYPHPYP